MQDQRILETDEVTRFGRESSLSHLNTNNTSDECEFPMCAHEGASRGNWQFQNSKRIKQKIKRIIQRELQREDVMSEEEASEVISQTELVCLLFNESILRNGKETSEARG